MNRCFITLEQLPESNTNPLMKDSAAQELYGCSFVSAQLGMTRKELLVEGRRFVKGISIPGVQPKLPMKVDNISKQLTLAGSDGEYILKPTRDGFHNYAEMEHLCMEISRALGIDTALCGLVQYADGELAYITKRFDRTPLGKLHQEDLCSLSDKPTSEKYNSTYEEAGRELLLATGAKVSVQCDYFQRVLAAYLVGNDDFHLKNFSVQRLAGNRGLTYDSLTPNYDCLCTEFYELSVFGLLAMPLLDQELNGEYSEAYEHYGYYTKTDFLSLADAIGIGEQQAIEVLERLGETQQKVLSLIEVSFISDKLKAEFKALVEGRYRAICAEY
ncbi:type II toxin-antitoxin system HipA family toxin [uncultured Neptuniibacter sp.]|uniref:type II toxin-antitoxin system HipA family toxin n=1 Tax=uncultured Neptuniibacter sp. TaxID=502143 RepID=UPI00262D15EE|nr:HipA domain-containing protein [uncultured Neptuniibacter sp.]